MWTTRGPGQVRGRRVRGLGCTTGAELCSPGLFLGWGWLGVEGEGCGLAPAPGSLPGSVPAPWPGPSAPCGHPQASAYPLFPPPLPPTMPLAESSPHPNSRVDQLPRLVDLRKPPSIHSSNGTVTSPAHKLMGIPPRHPRALPSCHPYPVPLHLCTRHFLCPTTAPLSPSNASRP